jgi:hypothetical protein
MAGRLYSNNATVTLTINNVRPVISDMSDGSVAHNQEIARSFTYSDACTSPGSLSVTANTTGGESATLSNVSNGNGTVTWKPLKSTVNDWCAGPTAAHVAQSGTVSVNVSDGNLSGSGQFNAYAATATECGDECTYAWGAWCHTDAILPQNCQYCRDYYTNESYCCDRYWWGGCAQTCYYQERHSTCNDQSSTLGVLGVIANWFQSAACWVSFGLIPCPAPPNCWWD